MSLYGTESTALSISITTGCLIALIFLIAMIIHILKKYLKERKMRKDSLESTQPSTHITTLVYFELFTIFGVIVCATVAMTYSYNTNDCRIIAPIWFALFHSSRCILYFIFIRRISVVYTDTIFAFNKLHETIAYILITIYLIIYISLPFIVAYIPYAHSILSPLTVEYSVQYGCMFEHKPLSITASITSSLFNILMIIYALRLFVHPLRALIKLHPDEQTSGQLYVVVIKYCILHACLIVSAIAFIVACLIFPFGFRYSVVDAFMNGMVLMLLDPIHNKVYKKLCYLPHLFCKDCICTPRKNKPVTQPLKPPAAEHPEPVQREEEVVRLNESPKEEKKRPDEPNMRDLFKGKIQQRYLNSVKVSRDRQRVRDRSPTPYNAKLPSVPVVRLSQPQPEPGAMPVRLPRPRPLWVDPSVSDLESSASLLPDLPLSPKKGHYREPSMRTYVRSHLSPRDIKLTEDEFDRKKKRTMTMLSWQSDNL
eukprot:426933_1